MCRLYDWDYFVIDERIKGKQIRYEYLQDWDLRDGLCIKKH